MQTTISMTSNWQIHLPLEMRLKLGIDRATQFFAKIQNGTIVLKPQKEIPMMKYFGAFKSKKKLDMENLRDYIDYSDL